MSDSRLSSGLLLRWLRGAWPAWLALVVWLLAVPLVVKPQAERWAAYWYKVPASASNAAEAAALRDARVESIVSTAWQLGAVPVVLLFLAELLFAWQAPRPSTRPVGNDGTDKTVIRPALDPGAQPDALHIGPNRRYRVDRLLASGGMGSVHRGYDTLLKRDVAIKELDVSLASDEEQSDRFRQEAVALAALAHPGIVPVYDLVEDQQRFWIVMELLKGGDLEKRIQENRPDVPAAIAIVRDVAEALSYAHGKGIVHRDIKPMNILFNADGSPKLVDFGVAKLVQSTQQTALTQEGMSLGSPTYMSPEQAIGSRDIDARTDIYALGITLYKLLAGEPPFTGDAQDVMLQHLNAEPGPLQPRNPAVSEALEAVVLKMLAKRREDRYASMDEVVKALDSLAVSAAR